MNILVRCMFLAAVLAAPPAFAAPLVKAPPKPDISQQAIDTADFDGWRARVDAYARYVEAKTPPRKKKPAGPPKPLSIADPDPFLIRAQVLLDRAHASPGAIDGRDGPNFKKAVRVFREMRGLKGGDNVDPEFWAALSADSAPVMTVYEISANDLKTPFNRKLPSDYSKLARLKTIAYRTPAEMFAERFHLHIDLIGQLNPEADFKARGQKLLVPDTTSPEPAKIVRIEIDKELGELRGFAEDGKLALAFPATVGSSDTPSPSGDMKVNGSFPNPHYIYDPKKNFQQGNNKRKLTLPPGPNGPVGSMWIDLTKPTYGIHGTPEPEKISKSGSHGCVRLTNWDAGTLGPLVEKGKTTVVFR